MIESRRALQLMRNRLDLLWNEIKDQIKSGDSASAGKSLTLAVDSEELFLLVKRYVWKNPNISIRELKSLLESIK